MITLNATRLAEDKEALDREQAILNPYLPYSVNMRPIPWREDKVDTNHWCLENFGSRMRFRASSKTWQIISPIEITANGNWGVSLVTTKTRTFYFANSEDAVSFKMVWG